MLGLTLFEILMFKRIFALLLVFKQSFIQCYIFSTDLNNRNYVNFQKRFKCDSAMINSMQLLALLQTNDRSNCFKY